MKNKYRDLFVKYLQEKHKYPERAIRANTYKYAGKEYARVEVVSDGYIIQAFVLMDENTCGKTDKFPFYRTYFQRNEYGYNTPPACNIAVYHPKNEKWTIHSSSDLKHELTSPSFLNYDSAVERFRKRLKNVGNENLGKLVKWFSWVYMGFLFLYFVAYLLSVNGLLGNVEIPLNTIVVIILIFILVLLLLPKLLPYIKSITIHGLGLEFNQE